MTTPPQLPLSQQQLAFPVQRTWAQNTVVGAGELNGNLRDAVNYLLSPPRCIIYCANPQQINSGNPPQPFALDTRLVDTGGVWSNSSSSGSFIGGMWSSSFPSRIYMPIPGVYQVRAYLHYPYTSTANTSYQLGIGLNSNGLWPAAGSPQRLVEDTRSAVNSSAFGTSLSVRAPLSFNQGDYIEIFTEQATGQPFAPQGGQFASQVSVRWLSPT